MHTHNSTYLAFKLAVFCWPSFVSDGNDTELRFEGGFSGLILAESLSDDAGKAREEFQNN